MLQLFLFTLNSERELVGVLCHHSFHARIGWAFAEAGRACVAQKLLYCIGSVQQGEGQRRAAAKAV